MVHICYPGTMKEDTEGLGIQGHLQLHREVEASLGYVILSQKNQQIKTKRIFRIRGKGMPSQY